MHTIARRAAAEHLTSKQALRKKRLETIIKKAMKFHLMAAKALLEIRDQRLYRDQFDTFENYCASRFGISRQHGNRLCGWADVARNLEPIGSSLPVRESHARPLRFLTPDQQRHAWNVLERNYPVGFSADDVEAIARQVQGLPVSNGCHEVLASTAHVTEEHVPLRSPLAWYGGKGTLASKIVALMPSHRIYMEPFFGGGSVLFAKPPSLIEIANDLHHRVADFFSVLRNEAEARMLQQRLKSTPYSREEHRRCVEEQFTGDRVEDARRFFVSVRQSYGGIEDDSWSVSISPKGQRFRTFADIVDNLLVFTERLRKVQIECRDAMDLIGLCDRRETVMYVDPPYPSSHRSAENRGYKHEMDDAEHRRLLKKLNGLKHAKIVLSGYRCPEYDRALTGWRRYEWRTICNSAQPGSRGKKCERVEVVWTNF